METTIRQSYVNDINKIKKKLWESTYSDFASVDKLKYCITAEINRYGNITFNKDILQEITFDMNNMLIELVLTDIISNIALNTIFSEAFCNYIVWIYNKGELDVNEYNICKSRITMMFNLMLNTESRIVIKL